MVDVAIDSAGELLGGELPVLLGFGGRGEVKLRWGGEVWID